MNLEKQLSMIGFNKLQEKENFVFFAKSTAQNSKDIEQICIVYDKKRKKINSMDTFIIKNDVLNVVDNDVEGFNSILKALSS